MFSIKNTIRIDENVQIIKPYFCFAPNTKTTRTLNTKVCVLNRTTLVLIRLRINLMKIR